MPEEFDIKCVVSEESVPGGLKVDATPKSYNRYHRLFEAARRVRQIDDFSDLRIPHYPAFRPFEYQQTAVRTMLARFRGKGIFGDQVGLGKTVEVCMTVAEYAERGAINNALLLCPKKLDFQWAQEIKDKFSSHFNGHIVRSFDEMKKFEEEKDGGVTMYIMTFDVILAQIKSLKERIRENIAKEKDWLADQMFEVDKSEDFYDRQLALKRNEELLGKLGDEIDENYLAAFDAFSREMPVINMLVVDEADALLSTDPNKTLQIYTVVEHLGQNSSIPYKILMSATPIRRQLADVYRLMRIVRPEQFRDMNDFIKNYCFGKPRLNDFRDEELKQLSGLIDQLFTRNRLTSKVVHESLLPLSIKEVLSVNFDNFAARDFDERVRVAVIDGLCEGEQDPRTRERIENSMANFLSRREGAHWKQYIKNIIIDQPDMAPVKLTVTATDAAEREKEEELIRRKDAKFAERLLESISSDKGVEADALRFNCINYVIPPKRGHLIRYKGERATEEEAYEDALYERRQRKARLEMGLTAGVENSLEYYDQEELRDASKYVEFDRLVNELLPDKKVLVFSDAGVERNTFIRLVESVHKGRVLNGEGDVNNQNYLKFRGKKIKDKSGREIDDPKDPHKNAVYFAVNGEEKGFNMQFCSNLIITNLSHDPNLVEQIVGRISRISQKNKMHIYVFTGADTLEYSLYKFYNDDMHLFSDWDGDNTFIIGGAVASFLEENPSIHNELTRRIGNKHTADGEKLEIGFPQIVEYLWEQYDTGYVTGVFDDYEPWANFRKHVKDSYENFKNLVKDFGEQELFVSSAVEDDII